MFKIPRFSHAWRFTAVLALATLTGCSNNCAVPAFSLVPPGGGAQACATNAQTGVPLGTDATFAVLAGSTVTNTGTPTIVSGDLGVWAGTAITGFPPGQVIKGSKHSADPAAMQAQSDLTTAYVNAMNRVLPAPVTMSADIGGQTLTPGIYKTGSTPSVGITGTLTLDGQNQVNPVFIFQVASTLTTASNSAVKLINGANACNITWQLGSAGTLGTGTVFNGTILAQSSITLNTRATVNGRVLARDGAVTLDDNLVVVPGP
jgi:hypothetical protein